jgi:tRNA modification GTPase
MFRGKNLLECKGHTAHFGVIADEKDQVLDEVLVTVFRAPRSYTGEDTVEISIHGSRYLQQALLQRLIAQGIRLARPGEFTLRAFLRGKLDLSQAEAVGDLIAAETGSQARVALQQMRGGYSQELQRLRTELIDFAALIELELDFGEEDVEFANRDALRAAVLRLQSGIRQMIASFEWGNVIKAGVPTVIAGRPNAGKSTLLNALLREDRAIVSDIPGTTRDTIEEVLYLEGIAFRLIDTAGLRATTDVIEAIGVEKALAQVEKAALLLYLFDAAETSQEALQEALAPLLRPDLRLLLIANKSDLLDPATQALQAAWVTPFQPLCSEAHFLALSAREAQGIETLKSAMTRFYAQALHQEDALLVTNARHVEALTQASISLDQVLQGLDTHRSGDLVAMDLRHALQHLGSITGEVDVEELLGSIFSRFCIGK